MDWAGASALAPAQRAVAGARSQRRAAGHRSVRPQAMALRTSPKNVASSHMPRKLVGVARGQRPSDPRTAGRWWRANGRGQARRRRPHRPRPGGRSRAPWCRRHRALTCPPSWANPNPGGEQPTRRWPLGWRSVTDPGHLPVGDPQDLPRCASDLRQVGTCSWSGCGAGAAMLGVVGADRPVGRSVLIQTESSTWKPLRA